jgi:hypothetical protein
MRAILVPRTSSIVLASLVMGQLACEPPLEPRAEGIPLAPGEEREAGPAWRLQEGLVATTVVETGDPLSHNVSTTAPHFFERLESLSYRGDEARGFLWVDHGDSGSWLSVEREGTSDWILTLTTSNRSYAVPHARSGTPWGSLWSTSADWPPDEAEDASLPTTGPVACGWDRVAFARAADGELVEGAPIVMYAVMAGSPEPFKIVSRGSYELGLGRRQLLELVADARMFRGERQRGVWRESECPTAVRPSAAHPSADVTTVPGRSRVFFSSSDGIQMIEEDAADPASSTRFARTKLAGVERGERSPLPAPIVSDVEGGLWFARGREVFHLDANGEATDGERLATAPGGTTVVALAWNAGESSLFVGAQHGPERSSVVALSAR